MRALACHPFGRRQRHGAAEWERVPPSFCCSMSHRFSVVSWRAAAGRNSADDNAFAADILLRPGPRNRVHQGKIGTKQGDLESLALLVALTAQGEIADIVAPLEDEEL